MLRSSRWPITIVLWALAASGCAELKYDNTAVVFDHPPAIVKDTLAGIWLKTCYLYPARDYLTFTWLGRVLLGDEAWDVTPDGGVPDGPLFINREVRAVSPEDLRRGPGDGPPPVGPWRVKKAKWQGQTAGFIGEDAVGRSYLVKIDDPDYPELGTSAEMIGSRLTWLMGYRVAPVYLVTITGTGDARYDGRRATASALVPGRILGEFKFDFYRMRREIRALRLVAEWLNNTDCVDNNTLVVMEDGQTRCYLVDFNSSLGSWNGRPKEAWRGRRYAWDVEYQVLGLLTIGLLPRWPSEMKAVSPAAGTFDAGAEFSGPWRPQNPNTAFDRLTGADAAWMARRMAAVSTEQLRAIVAAAEYSRPADADYVLKVLTERRERILDRWGKGEGGGLDKGVASPGGRD